MDFIEQGATAPFSVRWYVDRSEPPVPTDVTGQLFQILRASDSSEVLAPTASSIIHITTGLYRRLYDVPLNLTPDLYTAKWTADGGLEAFEDFSVIAASYVASYPQTSGTYCQVEDLLLGETRLPEVTKCQKYIQDAADEIDSKLGFIYVTPIIISDPTTNRASILLLKRLNARLASGRLILALASSGEEQYVNAYGQSLITEALLALDALSSGQMPLPGATPINTDEGASVTGPIINNLDTQSNVESFYTWTQTPRTSYFPPYQPGEVFPGRN